MSRSKTSQSLDEKLQARNPVAMREQRQVIKPVDILEPQTNNATSPQVDNTTNPLVGKPTHLPVSQPTSPQVEKPTSVLVGKPVKLPAYKATSRFVEKYTTHLRPDTIKEIKHYSLDQDVHDYDVVQEALDQFFRRK